MRNPDIFVTKLCMMKHPLNKLIHEGCILGLFSHRAPKLVEMSLSSLASCSVLVAVLLLTTWDVSTVSACDDYCTCNNTIVVCSGLDKFPREVPIETTVLNLENNDIDEIEKDDVSSLSNLVELKLAGNPLECGCDLYWLKVLVAGGNVSVTGAACRVSEDSDLLPVSDQPDTAFECLPQCLEETTTDGYGTYKWDDTEVGSIDRENCEDQNNLKATRECLQSETSGDPEWGQVDSTLCSSSDFTAEFTDLEKNKKTGNAYGVAKKLENITSASQYFVESDVYLAVNLIDDALLDDTDVNTATALLNSVDSLDRVPFGKMVSVQRSQKTASKLINTIEKLAKSIEEPKSSIRIPKSLFGRVSDYNHVQFLSFKSKNVFLAVSEASNETLIAEPETVVLGASVEDAEVNSLSESVTIILTKSNGNSDNLVCAFWDNTLNDLEDNEITEIDFNDVYSVKELTELKLSGNPLECGCKLKWLYMALTAGDSDLAGVTITGAACKVTDSAELIPVEEHSETDFECEKNSVSKGPYFNLSGTPGTPSLARGMLPHILVYKQEDAAHQKTAPGIAKKLYNLTSAAEYFAATDMYLAVDVIDSLVIGDDSGTSDEVARDLLNSVDDLVRVDWGVMVSSQRSGKTASRLLKAIDKLARNVNSTMIDTENIGMNVVSIDPDDFDGMTFDSDSGERSNRRASIKLPALLLSGLPRELVKAQFISYKSNNFFMAVDEALTNDTSDEAESGSMYGTLNSAVIGASIGNVSITDLEEPVKITLAKINGKSGESTCVFWDFELNDDDGGWSPEGCSVSDDGDAEVVCECNHLTNFAVLSAEVSMAVKLSGSISLFVLLVSTWLFSTLV
uniref:Uncharacterized protein LOC102801748 n=1 Tax=Saccoglossus kowalevskii TaxID=10224 RepID=A0ABM0M4S6_SACKO|nr:PREDICTED: uncharacterized protein LOC102801748 [Saccoglossus kowalevskii]